MARVRCSHESYRFNTQPPEGGWVRRVSIIVVGLLFQHTAARRRLEGVRIYSLHDIKFQHTAARRRLVNTMTNCLSA